MKLLALCEPLDLDALTELAGEDAVDKAEIRGLIRITGGRPRSTPGSATRWSAMSCAAASERRPRADCGAASCKVLRDRELDSAASRIRMAQLSVDSDQAVEIDLLITAAKDAIFLSNLPLGERIARAAFERDGGLQAGELLSRALLWQGHPVQADEISDPVRPRRP